MAIRPRGPSAKEWVKEYSNRRSSWEETVSEWIDNSIGNGATRVDVEWTPRTVDVKDNGIGCTRKMFAALISPNCHVEDADVRNAVSRYGIGAKYGFCWCGGPTACFSRREDECYATWLDWQSVEDWSDFDAAQEGEEALHRCESAGMFANGLRIKQQHSRHMNATIFEQVRKKLAKRYWAAVETGVEIQVRFTPAGSRKKPLGGLLPGRRMPEFVNGQEVDDTLNLEDGRMIRICGGVLSANERLSDPGFEYIYGHRVVIEAGGLGAGGMDFERIYVRVFLLGDKECWRVTPTKDQLHDIDQSALAQAVFDRCKLLLEVAGSSDYASQMDQELLDEIAAEMTEANRRHARRPTRNGEAGTKTPTGTGGEHKRTRHPASASGKYNTNGERRYGAFTIRKAEFGDDDAHLVGKAKVADKLIRLNARHPAIREAFDCRDKKYIRTVANALWSEEWIKQDANGQRLAIPKTDFVSKFSAMLASQREIELAEAAN